jgi:N-acyl-phosphatidylethanolamine-hydrolysing phospholipase D
MTVSSSEPLDHRVGGRFRNRFHHEDHGFGGLWRWAWERRFRFPKPLGFSLVANDPAALVANRSSPTVTWIGHATFLLQLGGLNLLTDPQFSQRASPVSWAGPTRTTPPGLVLEDLPPIDVVLLSHSHYDHLDRPSLERLWELQPQPPAVFAPLGLGKVLSGWGLGTPQAELDWWQSSEHRGLSLQAVPAQHFSARTPFDRNRTLWAGWVLEHAGRRVYFVGDSGYSPDFREIRRRIGAMDLSLIPIGAYDPRWFMRPMHVNPEEAVQIHCDVGSKLSVAMHWGTFLLTDEPMDEPPKRLAAALEAAGRSQEEFRVLRHGETLMLDGVLAEKDRACSDRHR